MHPSPESDSSTPKPTPSKYVRLVWALWTVFLVSFGGIALFLLLVNYNLFGLVGGMPGLDNLNNPKSEVASEVYTADNVLLGKYFRENRSPVKGIDELSPNLIKALYATEDIRFEEHPGIDLRGILSTPFYLLRGKRKGSSTITQQLAKNLFSTRGDQYDGPLTKIPGLGIVFIKAKEWIVAIKLERQYTKEEILTMYLNTVDFGSNAFGIKVAAQTFFNTQPQNLKVEQAATLVGILKAPFYYSPIYNTENSVRRRNIVMDQMVKYGFLSADRADSLKALPYDRGSYKVESHNDGIATYFRAELKKELSAFCKENGYSLSSDGLRIYTTLDSRLQRYAEEAMLQHMEYLQDQFFKHWRGRNPWRYENGKEIENFIENAAKRTEVYRSYLASTDGDSKAALQKMKAKVPMTVFTYRGPRDTMMSPLDSIKYYKNYLHAALLSVEPQTGHIKAWVGGVNFRYFKYDHVRQGRRQPGSSFKPILYATAMEAGYTPCYEVNDVPYTFHIASTGQNWTPQNSDGKFSGRRLTLRKALAESINSVAAALMDKIGINKVVEMGQRLGIESPLDPVPALCLGSSDVTLYEMVGAYATFINKGEYIKPFYLTRIEDKNGNVIKRFNPEKREVLNPETAWLMVHLLRGSTIERNGTALGLYRWGNTLRGGNEVAAKTGTTSNYSDGWFMGCTQQLVTGVWVGGDERSIHFTTSDLGQGSRMALPIWSYYMDKVYNDPSTRILKQAFARPDSLSVELDCAKAGLYGAGDSTQVNPLKPGKLPEEF